jgi:hypothetical protein
MIGKPKSVKMEDLVQARFDRVHKESGKSRPARVGKAKKKSPLARPFLENDGWTLYHSGGGCIVWAKASSAGTMYMSDYNELCAPEDMRRDTACGVSISDTKGECILNMYFPSVIALLDSCIELDGHEVKLEPANERRQTPGVMRCPTCGAGSTCFNCRDTGRPTNVHGVVREPLKPYKAPKLTKRVPGR